MNLNPPQISCKNLPEFQAGDWDATERAFQNAESCSLRQHWLGEMQASFQPATVRAGRHGDSLWFYAQLTDLDIFNAATKMNQSTWKLGDVLEIFLRAHSANEYYEFHVTPENQILQLRWPNERDLPAVRRKGLNSFLIPEALLRTWTHIDHGIHQWRVLATLNYKQLTGELMAHGQVCDFSFCRYDATRGQDAPVISSSSSHLKPDFHRHHEWGKLRLEA